MTRKRLPIAPIVLAGGVLAILAAGAFPVEAASPVKSGQASTVLSYDGPDGQSYFAVPLRAPQSALDAAKPRKHVVLVDTSASQTGAHRKQALAVLKSFLQTLPKSERVRLFAVDMKAVALNDSFVDPRGSEITAATKRLRLRFPAGATDMNAAVNAALTALKDVKSGSVLYIGDGMSTANFLQSSKLRGLFKSLESKRLPVHSYAVGPRKDLQVLGMFAQRTGGVVLIDKGREREDDPEVAGRKLAGAVTAPIFYPDAVKATTGLKLMPAVSLPLRADRETIYLAKGAANSRFTVTVDRGNKTLLRQSVAASSGNKGYTWLRALWKKAEKADGLSVALAGRELMNAAHDEFTSHVSQLVGLGERYVAGRRFKQAEKIGLAIHEIDPGNRQAKALIGAARKLNTQTVAFLQKKQPKKKPPVPGQAGGPPDPLKKAAGKTDDEEAIQRYQRIIEVRTQELQRSVAQAIKTARSIAGQNAETAITLLKEVLDTVSAETQIHPGPKAELMRKLRTVVQEITSQREVQDIQRIRQLERQAQEESRRRLAEQIEEEEKQMAVLIDQVRTLILDGYHGHDEAFELAEETARKALDIRPRSGAATAALIQAESAGQLRKAFRLRALRADRWLETLYQVELSHVPFPDEPPIRWPSAEVWQALTKTREKWASVDLHKSSPAEERIRKSLSEEVGELAIIDETLEAAMTKVSTLFGIKIILLNKVLTNDGVNTDKLINHQLSGITLRSALNIILTEFEPPLTYVIEDEVMKITTVTDAEEKLSTRVYPVGDLVIPITTPQAGGLGQGLGGVGGLGGGGLGGAGQFGGGGLGFGGGGGIGGGGLGGGGFFSVPAAQMPDLDRNKKKPSLKKKPVGDPELQRLLDNVVGDATDVSNGFRGQAFAQVIDNEANRRLKKKARK